MNPYLQNIKALLKKYQKMAIGTIVKTKGSTPLKEGAKIIILPDKTTIGTIGGGALEQSVIQNAMDCINTEKTQLFEHHLTKDHQMCCGGTVWVFIEVISLPPTILIFGAGHVGQSLADISAKCEFETIIIDNRKEWIEKIKSSNKKVQSIYSEPPEDFVKSYHYNIHNTYCVITTYNHQLDKKILLHSIKKPFKYIGIIGSKRKTLVTKKFLKENTISDEMIEKIDMPIGLSINAVSAYEIAIAIIGKIIEVKNKVKHHPSEISEKLNTIELCYQNMSL